MHILSKFMNNTFSGILSIIYRSFLLCTCIAFPISAVKIFPHFLSFLLILPDILLFSSVKHLLRHTLHGPWLLSWLLWLLQVIYSHLNTQRWNLQMRDNMWHLFLWVWVTSLRMIMFISKFYDFTFLHNWIESRCTTFSLYSHQLRGI